MLFTLITGPDSCVLIGLNAVSHLWYGFGYHTLSIKLKPYLI